MEGTTMFENLQKKMASVFKTLSGKGRISESNIKEAVNSVKLSLLEADVNYKVVKELVEKLKVESIGAKVMQSLSPDQEFIRIVRDELVEIMGGKEPVKLDLKRNPAYIMLAGLQGSGKTTSAAKLAKMYKEKGRKPLLVAADTYRPAAIEQLVQLGRQIDVRVFSGDRKNALEIVKQAKDFAIRNIHDIVIIDTAGRLHIDSDMMAEVRKIHDMVNPDETLMVVDSMMGQDAVRAATEFNNQLELSGFIITKLDGDSRGGVIISIRYVTSKPIKLVGLGEKLDNLEPFYAERYAGRVLGMGDVLTLIEKVEKEVQGEEAEKAAQKFLENKFDLEDFLQQLKQIKKLGPLSQILEMLPGNIPKENVDIAKGEKQMKKMEAIIQSMTPQERKNPKVLNFSRKQRVAKGSGTSLQEINKVLQSYEEMKKMMKQFKSMGKKKFFGKMPFNM